MERSYAQQLTPGHWNIQKRCRFLPALCATNKLTRATRRLPEVICGRLSLGSLSVAHRAEKSAIVAPCETKLLIKIAHSRVSGRRSLPEMHRRQKIPPRSEQHRFDGLEAKVALAFVVWGAASAEEPQGRPGVIRAKRR